LLGRDGKIIDPYGLSNRRPIANVRRNNELIELHWRVRASPEQDVATVDEKLAIEPIPYHSVTKTFAFGDCIQLDVSFNEVPVVLI
jgi:hypothetical protein